MNNYPKLFRFVVLSVTLGVGGSFDSLHGQIAPTNDPNWNLETALSDEFNDASLDITKWEHLTCSNCCPWGGDDGFIAANSYLQNGTLLLRCTGASSCGYVSTGGVRTINENYDYGYMEMRAIFPGFLDAFNVPHADKFWPAFWTYEGDGIHYPACTINHDEIDIVDVCCCQYSDGSTYGAGAWDDGTPATNCAGATSVDWKSNSPGYLFAGYHKYAVEWNTDRMIFYFDDIPWYTVYKTVSMDPMKAVIDLQIENPDGDPGGCDFHPSTPFPQYMTIDYFRYYTLDLDCSTDAVIANNSQLGTFNYAVKNSVTVGNGTSSITMNALPTYTLRATDEIIFTSDITVPLGTELNSIITPCN
ncbi:MAG: glycoside hydrolase family 16 protein [Crocinitomicaceae bacterium]|nr:glycoside hydrolase family 16 protein [Crocinitomicaceae bacterium]